MRLLASGRVRCRVIKPGVTESTLYWENKTPANTLAHKSPYQVQSYGAGIEEQ